MRYGAGFPRHEQIEHQTKPAPNTPYATSPRFPIPDSRFPIPCSRFPIPCSLFPVPCSLNKKKFGQVLVNSNP
ncbi:MAG: hypothetical protein F6K55_18680 [Moorea sp. SIO4A3]|nr:hypothetical protein [Moorena sp. SIO4A3]